MRQDLLLGRLVEAEQAVLRLWSVRTLSGEVPAVAAELVHAVIAALGVSEGWQTEVSEPAYALGVLRAQEGRDVTALVEDLLALRQLSWGQVAADPDRHGDFAHLVLLQDRLCELTDLALRCAVDAFVDESTRVLAALATRDVLTGLLNRAGLQEFLQNDAGGGQAGQPPALLLIDLDGFKKVNDVRGHLAGDEILKQVAELLETVVSGVGAVARLGGDEFAVALPAAGERECVQVAERLLAAARAEARLCDKDTPVRLSIGVATVPGPASVSQLLARADEAMYQAKRAGGDRIRVLTHTSQEQPHSASSTSVPRPGGEIPEGRAVRR